VELSGDEKVAKRQPPAFISSAMDFLKRMAENSACEVDLLLGIDHWKRAHLLSAYFEAGLCNMAS